MSVEDVSKLVGDALGKRDFFSVQTVAAEHKGGWQRTGAMQVGDTATMTLVDFHKFMSDVLAELPGGPWLRHWDRHEGRDR